MGNRVFQERARHLVSRLAKMQLGRPEQFDSAVELVERTFTSMSSGEGYRVLADVVSAELAKERTGEDRNCSTGASARHEALEWCLGKIRENATAYVHPTLEDWWETTAYQDVVDADDAAFRDKPIHLKRIALEAFNVARRTRVFTS